MVVPHIIRLTFFALFILSIVTQSPSFVFAQGDGWPQITLTLVQNELSFPVHVTHAGDGSSRLFIVEQTGSLRIFRDGTLLSTAFLSIGGPGGRVNCCGERGLLSVAFPPDYATKQYFYVAYTNLEGALVVARYHTTVNPDVADSNTEEILLTIPHPTYSNHNGGQIAFSPNDGYLYVSTGDGGGGGDPEGNGQNPLSRLGKLLRIDVESDPGTAQYVVPSSNPYKNNVNYLAEIWALGLRNPWRFGFDRQTGDLYIGDVGQNAYEEINFQPASSPGGKNYGWRCREGTHEYEGHASDCAGLTLTAPVTQYSHLADCSVTGGLVYRGLHYPSLQGIYFYGDFCSGGIRGLRRTGTAWKNKLLLDSSLNISSFGEGEDGALYVADLSGALYVLTALPSLHVDLTGSWDTVRYTCRNVSSGPRCRLQGRFLLRNQGIQRAPIRSFTKFYLSSDDSLSPDDVELRTQRTGRLASGRTTLLSFHKNLPIGSTALNQFVIAVVDAEHGIAEIEENNNIVAFGPIQ